jgi:uncharacterized protein
MKDLQRPLPRLLAPEVRRALASFPVVVVTGPRQSGKSTLVRSLVGGARRDYLNLDDLETLERAQREPDALLPVDSPVTIDEIQRVPSLLLAIKRRVDDRNKPGRFLLTGSANLLLQQTVSESLAGRAVYLTLLPFTCSERTGKGGCGPWAKVMQSPGSIGGAHPALTQWKEWVTTSAFPKPSLAREKSFSAKWLDGYVRTYLERDLQSFARIDALVDFRRLLRLVALRTGGVQNQADLSRDAGLSSPTCHRYLNLLEASYLLHRVPAYAVNRTKRLIKAPRMFWCDPGLASHLSGIQGTDELQRSPIAGTLLENLVLLDLLAWRESVAPKPEVLWWRTTTGIEVDFVVEHGGKVVPIEIKAGARPRLQEANGLRAFLDEYGSDCPHGVLLHTGAKCEQLGERIWAVPLSAALGITDRDRAQGGGGRLAATPKASRRS